MKCRKANIIKYSVDTKGFTLVELIVAMAVMSLLVTACFSLFYTGQNTYGGIYGKYQHQNEARIAMSYLNVKIRQNDFVLPSGEYAVQVMTSPNPPGKKYLRVFIGPGDDDFDYIYEDTNGALSLTQNQADAEEYKNNQTLIADRLEGISISSPLIEPGVYDKSIINIEIEYGSGNKLTETIKLRSDIS
jgi:prepilin-type N-terminal cleavage/methylation domain-containing protein